MDVPPAKPRRRVLIVEDHPTLRVMTQQLVEGLGYDVTTAATMAEVREVDIGAYDLVFCDLRLPDGDAPQWVAGIRRAGVGVPVVLLTAFDQRALADHQTAGFDLVLTKPVDLEELREALERFCPAGGPSRSPDAGS